MSPQRSRIVMDRRRFLTALGLGGASLALPGALGLPSAVRAGGEVAPRRVVFFVSPHGTVWDGWNMNVPGLAPSATSSASIAGLGAEQFSEILRPLAAHRQKLTVVEGLARTVAIDYEGTNVDTGNDLNRHHFGQATLMTCVHPMQRPGSTCIGGGESIDQVLGRAVVVPGRWASRVYGFNHQHPYSFVSAGEASPRVEDPSSAFDDILGLYTPPDTEPAAPSRSTLLRRGRASALDLAAREFDYVKARVGREDREKLERHAQLIRDLELSFDGGASVGGPSCSPVFERTGATMEQFARVMTVALACDMTRVATFVVPSLGSRDIGFSGDIHQDYAHHSIGEGNVEAERAMVAFNLVYAEAFAYLLAQLDSVPEGDGTLLDHTAVVWLTECSTGSHELRDLPIVIGGGAGGFLRSGQYVRYERSNSIDAGWSTERVGPSQTQLYVTLMRAMGMPDETFGVESVRTSSGSTLPMRGVLPELVA
jgi:hypothetical protein